VNEDRRPSGAASEGEGLGVPDGTDGAEPETEERRISGMIEALDQYIEKRKSEIEEESAALLAQNREQLQELIATRARMEQPRSGRRRPDRLRATLGAAGRFFAMITRRGWSGPFRGR
jgi:hypothetical protein